MARPRKQTVDYFPHDTDASDKKTLTILQSKYGNDGYAFWFKLLELLGKAPGHYIRYENPVEWEFLLAKTHIDEEKVLKILETLTTLDAIDKELYNQKCIWCQNFVDGLADVYERRSTDLPVKPCFGEHNVDDKGVSDNHNRVSVDGNPQSKVKERKVKETKLNNNIDIDNILISGQSVAKIRQILAGGPESTGIPEHIKEFWKRELARLGIPVEETTQDKK